jgi:O-antigen/teichoic acid export membrane protein
MFLRNAAWVYGLVGPVLLRPESFGLPLVLSMWAAGELAALLLAAYWMSDWPWREAFRAGVDREWLRRGIRIAMPLLVSTLALQGISAADRYALQWFGYAEELGVYTFYGSIRNAIQSLLDVSVVPLFQVQIISAYQEGRLPQYRRGLRHFLWSTVGLTGVLCVGAAVFIRPLLRVLNNPVYGEHLGVLWMVLVLLAVNGVLTVLLAALYARRRDRQTLVSCSLGLVTAVALNALLVPALALPGAVLATLGGFLAAGACSLWRGREQEPGPLPPPTAAVKACPSEKR